MKTFLSIFALAMTFMAAFAQTPQSKSETQTQTADTKPPVGWWKTGSHPGDFDFYTDPTVRRSGKASATLRSKPTDTKERFAAMMQTVKPDNYRGKRIRLSGYLKTEHVAEYSGFWLRIDGTVDNMTPLAFDNMENRPVKGTTGWKKYELVLDVSNEAELIAFGVNLRGSGQVWADDLRLEIVGSEVASTNLPIAQETIEAMKKEGEEFFRKNPEQLARHREIEAKARKTSPMQPVNLDFEQ